jgi:hypothetical protein
LIQFQAFWSPADSPLPQRNGKSGLTGRDNIADTTYPRQYAAMTEDSYKGSGTPGGLWGCLTAALIGTPLVGFAFLVSALGDCAPDELCKHGLIWSLFIPAILIAATAGLSMRWVINWFARRRSRDRSPNFAAAKAVYGSADSGSSFRLEFVHAA